MRHKIEKSAESGDCRQRAGFLWLPKEINDEIRWLEFAFWTEQLKSGLMEDGPRWEGTRWLFD